MVFNRIEQKQRQLDEAERERLKREEARNQAYKREEQEARRKEAERLQFVRNQTQKALSESGVLQALKEIRDKKLKGSVRKYALLVSLDEASAQLVWGDKFSVKNNVVVGEEGYEDYQSVSVVVNPDTLELSINPIRAYMERDSISWRSSRNYSEKEWRNDPGVVLDGLAAAYLDPERYSHRPPSSSSLYSSPYPG